ncbi:ABC transporter permease [Microbacterium sp. C7(2022)]|uniref:ABC transporter permease n=1 Tax=Microbacterium sp. C7(2022) TaxID=2992759 RepID=UPI00237C4FBE|nr:ABC transporter permease [Microbacterium sp. C7(2022)]MDE0545287.1 ABC transporter permease [Microbacterium sp. C7(2022)]
MSTLAVHPDRRTASATHTPAESSTAWLRERGMGASVLVAAISTTFGVVLLSATAFLAEILRTNPYVGDSETLAAVLAILSILLIGVAVYVAAIVTANTFSTVIAGRTRRIALMRLIGASASSRRTEVARQGLIVGVIGAACGLVVGVALSALGATIAVRMLPLGDIEFSALRPEAVIPAVVVALTTWVSAWVGSRAVLAVTPLQALGTSVESPHEVLVAKLARNTVAVALLIIGGALIALGVLAGLVTPLGVVVAFFGGILSFTGLALGATLIMPPVLRLVGRMFGASVPARLAAENALRYPARSSRMAIGVVMGVTLVTMFAVALESSKAVLAASGGGELPPEMEALIDTFSAIMMGIVAISAVIAGVGLVNLLTLGVVQRRRELGLLRALGVASSQVRRMVLLEAAHVTITATALGLLLGVVYGWAGAQSLLGSVPIPPEFAPATFVWPAVPVWPVVVIVAATAVLTLVATIIPTRLATSVAPVEALVE